MPDRVKHIYIYIYNDDAIRFLVASREARDFLKFLQRFPEESTRSIHYQITIQVYG